MSTKRQENGKAYFHLTYKLPSWHLYQK